LPESILGFQISITADARSVDGPSHVVTQYVFRGFKLLLLLYVELTQKKRADEGTKFASLEYRSAFILLQRRAKYRALPASFDKKLSSSAQIVSTISAWDAVSVRP
jgi:hypothetical protein